jgi:hypothetical protein
MVEDNPKMNELEELASFCAKNDEIYIYGHDVVQKMISKYLAMANIRIKGFIMPEIRESDRAWEPFPIYTLVEAQNRGGGTERKLA